MCLSANSMRSVCEAEVLSSDCERREDERQQRQEEAQEGKSAFGIT